MNYNKFLFFLGPPRTASTWTYNIFKLIDNVSVPYIKQLHFFDNNFDKGVDWYLSHFNLECPTLVDFTPDYFTNAIALKNINATFPGSKYILVYRDPLERAFSHFKLRFNSGFISTDFHSLFKSDPYLFNNSLYGLHLKNLLGMIHPDNIVIINFTSLISNPKLVLPSIFTHFGFDPIDIDFDSSSSKPSSRFVNNLKSFLKFRSFNVFFSHNLSDYSYLRSAFYSDIVLFNQLILDFNIKRL